MRYDSQVFVPPLNHLSLSTSEKKSHRPFVLQLRELCNFFTAGADSSRVLAQMNNIPKKGKA
jgi:hypothetical protein